MFAWRYSFDSIHVADDRWLQGQQLGWFYGLISTYPLPNVVALLARIAEIGVTTICIAMSFTAALLFDELSERADSMIENRDNGYNADNLSNNLETWRYHYTLVCRYVKKINKCFGLILLFTTAIDFSIPMFEFNMLYQSKGQFPQYYFEFGHSILRFLVLLVPSSLVKQKVTYVISYIEINAYLLLFATVKY